MQTYADYMYYATEYGGHIIPEDEYTDVIREASVYLRETTHDRIGNDITDDVKMAVCAVAEVYYQGKKKLEDQGGKEIKSENNDGYSVTYVTEGKDGESHHDVLYRKMYLAARKYLIHTDLLYAGWCG